MVEEKGKMSKFVAEGSSKKHTLPFILMVIGGFLILLGGIYDISLIHAVSANAIISNLTASNPSIAQNATELKLIHSYVTSGALYDALYAAIGVGIICGILVMLSGVMVYNPKGNRLKIFSIVAIVFSLISLVGSAGFIIGMVLGIIGGILGLMKK